MKQIIRAAVVAVTTVVALIGSTSAAGATVNWG